MKRIYETGYEKFLILYEKTGIVGYTENINLATETDLSISELMAKYKYIDCFHNTIQLVDYTIINQLDKVAEALWPHVREGLAGCSDIPWFKVYAIPQALKNIRQAAKDAIAAMESQS